MRLTRRSRTQQPQTRDRVWEKKQICAVLRAAPWVQDAQRVFYNRLGPVCAASPSLAFCAGQHVRLHTARPLSRACERREPADRCRGLCRGRLSCLGASTAFFWWCGRVCDREGEGRCVCGRGGRGEGNSMAKGRKGAGVQDDNCDTNSTSSTGVCVYA